MKRRFDLQPLVGPSPIRFGMSEEQVDDLLGKPQTKSVNSRNEQKWDYDEFIVTFGSIGEGVVEVAFLPEAEISLFGINLFGDQEAFAKVLALNEEAFEDYGFIVFPALGLAFSGFHDEDEENKAVGIFVRGRWDDRKKSFVPFKPHVD